MEGNAYVNLGHQLQCNSAQISDVSLSISRHYRNYLKDQRETSETHIPDYMRQCCSQYHGMNQTSANELKWKEQIEAVTRTKEQQVVRD